MAHHAVDIQWGNHDVEWMGAAAGSAVCIASVIHVSLSYNNLETLEDGYGLNLRPLALFAEEVYRHTDVSAFWPKLVNDGGYSAEDLARVARMHKAIAVILCKLECQVVRRNPDFGMLDRALLEKVNFVTQTVEVDGKVYRMRDCDFPTVDPAHPSRLTQGEQEVMDKLCQSFTESERLARHVRFLYANGSVYKIENHNLLFHGAIPFDENGQLAKVFMDGQTYCGREFMDYCERMARQGYFAPLGSEARRKGQDFLWYLWCGRRSPIFGRYKMANFEHFFLDEEESYAEQKDPYYYWVENDDTAVAEAAVLRIFENFGLDPAHGHIVNGHVPVRAKNGEKPVKAGGRLIVIDGGFCKAYHKRTGIAGYTLVFSSRGLSLRSHGSFETTQKAIRENADILSTVNVFETSERRVYVEDTDEGLRLQDQIEDLKRLVAAYADGTLKEQE